MDAGADAHLVALDLGLATMYILFNLSRDISATPFSSVVSQFSFCISKTTTVSTHETFCPAFNGSLMKGVNVELGIRAIVGMRM
jgi:hypothetical protein